MDQKEEEKEEKEEAELRHELDLDGLTAIDEMRFMKWEQAAKLLDTCSSALRPFSLSTPPPSPTSLKWTGS